MHKSYLVTGGAGFIGSNFIRFLLQHETNATVINLDLLTYAGVKATVDDLDQLQRHRFVRGDIRDAKLVDQLVRGCQVVVNFAAESHVDRSITDPSAFLSTNVMGTGVLLAAAYRHQVPRFIQVSTDEVYGPIAEGVASEEAALLPSSPYAASKAAADLMVHAYAVTYGYPAVITRCTNNYGPYQFPEKVIPRFITNLLDDKQVPLYGQGTNQRDWLHVEDHCAALHLLISHGMPGEIYNIGLGAQLSNLELTRRILELMGKDDTSIQYVSDRLGHDLRYAVDSSKLRALGWAPQHSLAEGLAGTVEWYREHQDWWRPLVRDQP